MKEPKIYNIFVDSAVKNSPATAAYVRNNPQATVEEVELMRDSEKCFYHKSMSQGKQGILLTQSDGQTLKQCPGTDRTYRCCNYHVINQTLNCPIDCTYCILQFYPNNPVTIVYADTERIFKEIKMKIATQPDRFFRIGTGELSDSLVFDASSEFSKLIVAEFAKLNNVLLELKTKSNRIENLIGLNHSGHTVVAWSLNPPEVIDAEEHKAASLDERLEAAKLVEDDGYKLAFHFDPILHHEGWEENYENLIDRLFNTIKPENVTWISMGSLRFPPSMKEKVLAKFPKSKIMVGELIRGMDRKMRYTKPLRLAMYRHVYRRLRTYGGGSLFVYFCMESADVWKNVLGWTPESNEHLDYLFAESLYRRFPGLMKHAPKREVYENAFPLRKTPHNLPGTTTSEATSV